MPTSYIYIIHTDSKVKNLLKNPIKNQIDFFTRLTSEYFFNTTLKALFNAKTGYWFSALYLLIKENIFIYYMK